MGALEVCAVTAIIHTLSFNEYRKLAEWLECYAYIPKEKRTLSKEIIELLIPRSGGKASSIFNAWLLLDMIESTLTHTQQINIVKWIVKE